MYGREFARAARKERQLLKDWLFLQSWTDSADGREKAVTLQPGLSYAQCVVTPPKPERVISWFRFVNQSLPDWLIEKYHLLK